MDIVTQTLRIYEWADFRITPRCKIDKFFLKIKKLHFFH